MVTSNSDDSEVIVMIAKFVQSYNNFIIIATNQYYAYEYQCETRLTGCLLLIEDRVW